MRPPFPGMDPWLEHPALWPDVHNRLITAIADAMSPALAPKYYIGLESRTRFFTPDELIAIGVPDLAVTTFDAPKSTGSPYASQSSGAVEVLVPMMEKVRETFLKVREAKTGTLVTLIELLSPANKLAGKGRRRYERKRERVFETRTNFVEIDLLRDGKPMPWSPKRFPSDYRILVSPEPLRPAARVFPFNLRDQIPIIHLPLLPEDEAPPMDLGPILHALYDRARFDLRLDYAQPPVPPLSEVDAAWAREIVGTRSSSLGVSP